MLRHPFWRTALVLAVGLCLASASRADLKISGSETLENLFQDALSQYARGPGAGVPVTASYKGSGLGLRDLCEARANIVPASSRMDDSTAAKCQQAGVGYLELPLAFDAVVVIAHPSRAAMAELSMAELKTIFAPDSATKIMRWSQVRPGLPDTALAVVSLDPKSGTNAFFGGKVHGLRGYVRFDAKVSDNHADVMRAVAADPNAIGFVSLGALAESKAAVWRVPINFGKGAVVPNREAVLNDSYGTLSRVLYVYASKPGLAAKDGHSKAFAVWLMEHGARLAAYEGFVPLIEQNYQDSLRTLNGK
jgi:phosphate transport system substrate-binding protein